MHDEHGDDGLRALPWAFVLDPAANAHALGDVQRRGVHAARLLVDRVVAGLDRLDGAGSEEPRTPLGDAGASPEPVMELVQAWSRLLGRTLEAFGAGAVARPPARGRGHEAVDVDVVTGRHAGVLGIDVEKGVTQRPTRLYLGNPSAASVGPLRVHVGELRTSEGESLPSSVLEFDPGCVAELPPDGDVTVAVTATLPEPVAPGTYRSVVQVAGAPAVSVPISVTVRPLSP